MDTLRFHGEMTVIEIYRVNFEDECLEGLISLSDLDEEERQDLLHLIDDLKNKLTSTFK